MEQWEAILREHVLLGNTVGHIAAFVGALFATALGAKLAQWLVGVKLKGLAERSETKLDDILFATLERPVYYVLLMVGARFSCRTLALAPAVDRGIERATLVAVTVLAAWTVNRLIDGIYEDVVRPATERSESKLDDHIIPVLRKTAKLSVSIFALLVCFSNLGIDVISLLTGLGLGGLAVAMAAQDTIANMIGSVTILADHPFRVGDLVRIGDHLGVVEEIGLRACRIRTLQGALVNIPNKEVTSKAVTNLSETKTWRYDGSLRVAYGLSAEELRRALGCIREALAAHPALDSNVIVRFMRYADSAFQIEFAFYVTQPTGRRYLDTISEVNLAIKDRFDAEGLGLALPALALHVAEPLAVADAVKRRPARVS